MLNLQLRDDFKWKVSRWTPHRHRLILNRPGRMKSGDWGGALSKTASLRWGVDSGFQLWNVHKQAGKNSPVSPSGATVRIREIAQF